MSSVPTVLCRYRAARVEAIPSEAAGGSSAAASSSASSTATASNSGHMSGVATAGGHVGSSGGGGRSSGARASASGIGGHGQKEPAALEGPMTSTAGAGCECWQWCLAQKPKRASSGVPMPPLRAVVAWLCTHPWQEKPMVRHQGGCAAASAASGGRGLPLDCAGGTRRQPVGNSVGSSLRNILSSSGRNQGASVPAIFERRLPCGLFPSQVSELLDRDITPDDYEMLLQLDESIPCPVATTADVNSLPKVCGKDVAGESCLVCLHSIMTSDTVTSLQCGHYFHRDCISKWLLERSRCCPLCSTDVSGK